MPKHLFFLKDPSLLGEQLAEQPADGAPTAKVPEWVMIIPAPDGDGKIYSRDNRVLHIDSLEKLAKRSNAALKKQKGGGLVDRDHETYGGFFVSGGGPAIGWAEEFEARPTGLFARVEWLPEAKQLIGSRQYRYTSAVVDGPVEAEVDEEAWSVTWHITPDLVEGFAITNIPALTTTSMFSAKDDRQAEELRLLVLKKLGLSADADNAAVKAAWLMRFTAPGAADADAVDDHKPDEEDAADQDTADSAGGTGASPPKLVPDADPAPDELALTRAELATARQRIAALEVEAGAAFVKSLLHSGRLTPAQRKAAEEQAKTPTGLAQLQALYEHAPTILPTRAAPHAASSAPATAPYGLMPLSYRLAREGVPAHEIAERLKETT